MRLSHASRPPLTLGECLIIEIALQGTLVTPEAQGALAGEIADWYIHGVDNDEVDQSPVDTDLSLIAKLRSLDTLTERSILERLEAARILRDQVPSMSHEQSYRLVHLAA